MTPRGEYQDPLSSDREAGTRALFREVRAETKPSGANVLSDASGQWFWWRCNRCGSRGPEHRERTAASIEARHHEDGCG